MNKETFEVIKNYKKLVGHLYNELEFELSQSEAENIVEPFDSYHSKTLKIGRHLDESTYVNEDGFISEPYEELERYTKVHILYNYDSGYTLCETTDYEFYLVPTKLIKTDSE